MTFYTLSRQELVSTFAQFCSYCWHLLASRNYHMECTARHSCFISQCYFIQETVMSRWRLPYWKSFFGYISTIYCPINAKFGRKKHDRVQRRVTWPEYQNISKTQGDGWLPFWKWFYRLLSRESSDLNGIWCADALLCFQGRSHDKLPKFCKFKIANGYNVNDILSD